MKHWIFDCKEISKKTSQAMDTRLPLYYRVGILLHLLFCRECSLFSRQVGFIREICRYDESGIPPEESTEYLSKEACERIKASLRFQS
ncbi:MAG: hypothetical protein HN931_03050 [Desulfobacterales bacterium]|nr:hypothetical protein [Desulfobacterales bacterium]